MTQERTTAGPLGGVKVLDLSWFGAGPIAGRALASAGADVIKVETVKRIDGLRAMAPRQRGARGYNVSGYFNNYNADKRSVTIDLTTERGHELSLVLVRWADVMLTNMTNRAVGQVGMDWETVSRENPRLVAAYMPMMGTTGRFKDFQGFGAMLTAICGMNYLAGFEENRPVGVGTNYPDYVVNPIHAYIAILAGLRHARKTGEGQMIDVSQYESSVAAMSLPLFQHVNGGGEYVRAGNRVPYAAPHGAYRVQDAAERSDRWVALACLTEAHWQAFTAEVCGYPEWGDDDRFRTLAGRLANQDDLDQLIAGWAAEQNGADLVHRLQRADIPAGIVQDAREVIEDAQLAEHGYFVPLEHAEAGLRLYDGPGWRMSESPVSLRRAAPMLGEHTFEVAQDLLGLSPDEIANLVADGVLQ
jgi:benzylsuccinate CoA-transferase BbsF subunit